MAIFDNMQKTYSPGVAPSNVIQYFERTLLENMKPALIHSRDGQKRSLPLNNGKTVNFRRFSTLPAVTDPLVEGVTPEGQSMEETAFTAMVKPYGAYMTMTDEFNLYALDNLTQEAAKLLSDQANLSVDCIARDPLHAGMNVAFPEGVTARSQITAANKLTPALLKKIVRNLKHKNVPTFADGYYHAIIHPDTAYDLTSDPLWVDVARYQDKSMIEKYEIGTMHGIKFFESTNAKIFTATGAYLYLTDAGVKVNSLTCTGTVDAATKSVAVTNAITPDEARALTGKMVDVTYGSSKRATVCVERVDYANKKIYLRWVPTELAGQTATTIVPTGAGASNADVYSTLVYGPNAYGTIELGGNGQNVTVIVKAPGELGNDPLNQRCSVGWKVKGFCNVILQDDFIVRVEHGCTE